MHTYKGIFLALFICQIFFAIEEQLGRKYTFIATNLMIVLLSVHLI